MGAPKVDQMVKSKPTSPEGVTMRLTIELLDGDQDVWHKREIVSPIYVKYYDDRPLDGHGFLATLRPGFWDGDLVEAMTYALDTECKILFPADLPTNVSHDAVKG